MITIAQAVEVIGPVDPADEALLASLIERATATLGRALNIYLGLPVERVEVTRGAPPRNGIGEVFLQEDPTPDEYLAVRIRLSPFAEFTDLLSPDAAGTIAYLVDGRVLRRSGGWPTDRGTVEVTYTAGFEAGAGPLHFQELVLQMVAERWAAIGTTIDVSGVDGPYKSRTLGDHSWTKWTPAELAGAASSLGIDWGSFVDKWRRRLA